MYDPTSGRFIQRDPAGFVAGGVNLYNYVQDEPTTTVDPDGMIRTPPRPEPPLAVLLRCRLEQDALFNWADHLIARNNGALRFGHLSLLERIKQASTVANIIAALPPVLSGLLDRFFPGLRGALAELRKLGPLIEASYKKVFDTLDKLDAAKTDLEDLKHLCCDSPEYRRKRDDIRRRLSALQEETDATGERLLKFAVEILRQLDKIAPPPDLGPPRFPPGFLGPVLV
jgi:hypothetical protein